MQKKNDVRPGRECFLPVSGEDLRERGISRLDFVYVIGDAYVDHPSFGPAIISRLLEAHGYSVGIIAQPDWKDSSSVTILGEPRLAFLVSAGNMDSMVNHYSVSRRRRKTDAYTPGGEMGRRPDRAAMVYCNLIRSVYRRTPIIAGGIEASLRRLAHYDYWSDSLRRSLLMDSGADLISYGMGEHSIVEIADALASGIDVRDITFIAGTCYKTKDLSALSDYELLPSYEELTDEAPSKIRVPDWTDGGLRKNGSHLLPAGRYNYAKSFYTQYLNTDPYTARILAEPYGTVYVVQNPPAKPLTQQEMDDVYSLPYARAWHPDYDAAGGIPALEEVRFSLISNRGCFGACNFCALTFHQGRIIQTRSDESILKEAQLLTEDPGFKGYIHDVGGPTANFRQPSCRKQLTKGVCRDRQCLFPKPCPNLTVDHRSYTELLKKLRALPGVKKVFVRSGVRFDYVAADPDDGFLRELVKYHISGQLKVAPEHVSDRVLYMLGKPAHSVYLKFMKQYEQMNRECGMDQYLVPYLMSSHPGCTMKEAIELAEFLRDIHHQPEQVQDFYPTPSTISTCMYYTGLDPRTMEAVYVPRNPHEKAMQRALMQFRSPAGRPLVLEALKMAGRTDLIGYGPSCLIRPDNGHGASRPDRSGKDGKRTADRQKNRSGASRSEEKRTRNQREKKQPGGHKKNSSSGRRHGA